MTAPTIDRAAVAERGRTVIDQRVVEKIASQAAAEVSAAGGQTGGLLGIGTKIDLDARPSASVQLAGRTATVAVKVGVAYPSPLRAVSRDIRRHLITRVGQLTGVEVQRVDVEIAWLVNDTDDHRSSRSGRPQ